MIRVLILYALIASTYTVGKFALAYAQPIFLIGVRMILGGSLLLGYVACSITRRPKITMFDWSLFAGAAFFHVYASFILEFWSLQYVTSAKASFMYNLSPFITALLAALFLHERLTKRKFVGLIVGFVGTLPILVAGIPYAEVEAGKFLFFSVPEVALLGAVITSCCGWIIVTKLVVKKHYSPFYVNGVSMLTGGIGALVTSIICEKRPLLKCVLQQTYSWQAMGTFTKTLSCPSWPNFLILIACVVFLILVANIIFYNFYAHLLKEYSPTFMALAGLSSPLFAALFGLVALGETVSWHFFASCALVMVGTYIFYTDENEHYR